MRLLERARMAGVFRDCLRLLLMESMRFTMLDEDRVPCRGARGAAHARSNTKSVARYLAVWIHQCIIIMHVSVSVSSLFSSSSRRCVF